MEVLHHGGLNVVKLLNMVQQELPKLKHIALVGGSGGGVAAAAWGSNVADMWPMAEVVAVADSALHVFPGTHLFQYFWEIAQYGQGPAAQQTPHHTENVPDFDWRAPDALAKHVTSHDGRLKLVYLSCMDDHVVYKDRKLMATFANVNETIEELTDPARQHSRTWTFLKTLHTCSPEGSVFSYIQDCSEHHQTRSGFAPAVPGAIDAETFLKNILGGSQPDPQSTNSQFWFEVPAEPAAECSSQVRRRRSQQKSPDDDETSGSRSFGFTGMILIVASASQL